MIWVSRFIRTVRELPFVGDVSEPPGYSNFDCYYGLNVSPEEPIDQLDGFLVALCIQNQNDSGFYPLIAGVYNSLNSSSPKEAISRAKRMNRADMTKRELLRNIMSNMGLNGEVYITHELWEDEDYWEIFRDVISNLDRGEIKKRIPQKRQGMRMKDFPKQVLGKMEKVVPSGFIDDWYSSEMYIPAEVAEAIYLKEKLGVSFKIGPKESESIYDDKISEYGIGIIGLEQPECMDGAVADGNGNIMADMDGEPLYPRIAKAVPYIWKKGQKRILFSDTLVDVAFKLEDKGNPSNRRARDMANLYRELTGNNGYLNDAEKIYMLVSLGRCRNEKNRSYRGHGT